MGVASAASRNWPADFTSSLPGTRMTVELRATHAPSEDDNSNSSLPTGWPLSKIRNLPLSAANPAEETAGLPGFAGGASPDAVFCAGAGTAQKKIKAAIATHRFTVIRLAVMARRLMLMKRRTG